MKILLAFLFCLCARTEANYLFPSLNNPSAYLNRHSMPILSTINWQRYLAGSSIMPRTRLGNRMRRYMSKIPTRPSSLPKLSNEYGRTRHMAPQINPLSYYWSVRYVPMMTPLWGVISRKKSSSSSSSSSSSFSEEDSSELKLNLQQLSRNKHFPKDKQNVNKLVKNFGVRFMAHASTTEESDESSSTEKGGYLVI